SILELGKTGSGIVPRLRPPLRITHSGSPRRKRPGAAIPLVFSGERHFREACGAASLVVAKRSGSVCRPPGRTNPGAERPVRRGAKQGSPGIRTGCPIGDVPDQVAFENMPLAES